MSVLRELAVKLGLDVDEASFTAGALAAEAIEKGLEAIVDVAKDVAKEFVSVVKESVELTERLELTSQSLGLTTDALQELTYAGSLTGIQMDEMGLAIGLLSRNMNAAAKGGDEQAKAFAKLGVHVKGADGKLRSADEVIGDVADKFAKMPDGAEKTALALELFGRSGKRMIPLLNKGSDGLAAMRQEAHELGLVLDEDVIKQGVEVEHNFKRLEALWSGIKNKAGATLFPVLKQLTDSAVSWVKANKDLIKQKIASVFQAIAWAGRRLLDVVDVLRGSFKLLWDIVSGVVQFGFHVLLDVLNQIGPVGRAAAIAFGIGWAIAAAPLLALAVALGGVLLLLNSIQRWREGKDSLFGDWMKSLDEWKKEKADDPWFVVAIKTFVDKMEKALQLIKDFQDAMGIVSPKSVDQRAGMNKGEQASATWAQTSIAARAQVEAGLPLSGPQRAALQAHGINPEGYIQHYSPNLGPVATPAPQPIYQSLSPTYYITPAQGVSPEAVRDAIDQHHDAMMEEAAAALGN